MSVSPHGSDRGPDDSYSMASQPGLRGSRSLKDSVLSHFGSLRAGGHSTTSSEISGGLSMMRSTSVGAGGKRDIEDGGTQTLPKHVQSDFMIDDVDGPYTEKPSEAGYDLYVRGLTYQVTERKKGKGLETRTLLNNITAQAFHGELLAVIGQSGSGKTTFLDALAGRIKRSSLVGEIEVNGGALKENFKRISGYVMQDDALFPMLTVRETLTISARLRLPQSMPLKEKLEKVHIMISVLGLKQCEDTRVGNESVRGISGGERRRVSIGVDVIHDPAVLFLDEPTSGLDSTSALAVMQTLSNMAKLRSRTLVLTIHQPSYRILETIDRLLVLAKGHVVYQGHHSGIVGMFNSMDRVVPDNVNVVEFLLDAIEEYQKKPDGLQALVERHTIQQSLAESAPKNVIHQNRDSEKATKFATSWFSECSILAERNFKSTIRTPQLFLSRVGLMIFVSSTLGTLFLRVHVSEKGIQQRNSFFSFTLALLIFTSTEALGVFLQERVIFIRETSRGAYRHSSYVLSGTLVTLPFLLILALIYSSISYFLVGLVADASAFFIFALTLFLVLAVANSFVSFVSGLVPDFAVGQGMISAVISYFFLFSGFFIARRSIPKYWIWLHYMSLFKYPYEVLLHNEFNHQQGEIWYDDVNSQDVLSSLSCGKVHVGNNLLIIVFFFLAYKFFFYVTLRYFTKNIRK